MNIRSKVFVGITAAIGIGFIAKSAVQWESTGVSRFLCYMAAAILASTLTARLPGSGVTRWLSSSLIIVGVLELSPAETMLMACVATLVQNFWEGKKRLAAAETLFNVCNVTAVATGLACWTYSVLESFTGNSKPLMLAAAATIYFVVASAMPHAWQRMTNRAGNPSRNPDWYFCTFPYYIVGLVMAGTIGWLSTHGAWQLILLAFPLVYATHLAYREHITGIQSSRKRGEAMAALHLRTIEALALAIDAKHRTSREHLSRMCTYSVEIARELGLSQDELAAVHAAALLHDVGNLAIPDHIMNKPGKLTAEEFEKVKIHPLIGAEILEQVGFPYPVVPIVKAHHERWNGSGYPLGISGEEIPIGARILAPIDCLNAQASERPYKTAIPLEEVIQEIARGAGSEFDPRVVEVLVRRYRELEDLTQADMKLSRKSLSRFREAPQAIFPEEASSDPDMDAAYGNSGFVSSIASAREEAQTLRDLLHILGNSLKLDETLPEFALRLRDLVDYDALVVYVLRGEKLVPEHATGEHLHLFASSEIPLGQGITGLAAQNRTPVLNGDPAIEPGYGSDSTRFEPLRSSLSIALHCNENVVGVLTLHSAAAEVYSQDDLRVLLGLQSKLALCVENALKFQQAESSAVTDFLTGLPNARSLFLHLDREIARCRRTGSSLAVMLCDLNGFKKINDQFGHLQGNKILKEFSDSLREVCREYDYVARMGGDEFVLIAPGMTREASEVRATLLNQFAVEVGIRVCGEPLLSLSVGTAFYMDDGWDADQLLSEADRRMYIVKQNHHAGVSNDSLPAGSPVSSLTSFAP